MVKYPGTSESPLSQPIQVETRLTIPSFTSTQILLEPYSYLLQIPGKEIRSRLIQAFNIWLDVPEEDLKVIKRVVGMLHTASLL